MTFRYPRWLPMSRFLIAMAMAVGLYLGTHPKLWGWVLFLPLFLVIMYDGLRTWLYAITLEQDKVRVAGFSPREFGVSDIAAINVWFAKGGRMAVVTFADRKKFSFPSQLAEFDELVQQLSVAAKVPLVDAQP